MSKLKFLVVAALLAGCQSSKYEIPVETKQIRPLTPEETEAVRAGVTRELKDPTSPIFGAIQAATGKTLTIVCGRVNAKNSFGGYTGDQNFYGYLSINAGKPVFAPYLYGSDPYNTQAINRRCNEDGIFL